MLEALLASMLSAEDAKPPVCPDDMRPIVGVHHDQVQRLCTDWRMGHCFGYWPFAVAVEGRVTHVRTCMDVYEWPNEKGEQPAVMVRFVEAERMCAAIGKRLCTEAEWETACEGPELWPLSYGHRQEKDRCNTDKPYRPVSEAKLLGPPTVRDREVQRLWQGAPSGAHEGCTSPFGVHDLIGNVEEWVVTSRPEWKYRSSLKGGFWSKPWAGCRGTNDSHGPEFRFYEVGFRCCKDPA